MMTSLYEYPPKGWVFGIQVGFRRQGSCSLRSGSKALCAMGLGFIFWGGSVYNSILILVHVYIYIYIYSQVFQEPYGIVKVFFQTSISCALSNDGWPSRH